MLIAALVLAGLAALLHVFIFYLESMAWTSARARSVFGTSPQEAETTKALAFNQGFYNLFLAVLVAIGLVAHLLGQPIVGITLISAGVGSMLAAALVLLLSSPDKRPAAIKQGTLPALAVIALVISTLL